VAPARAALPAGTTAANYATEPRRSRTTTYVVLACVIALVALSLLGALLNVGDHLSAAHPALGVVFYALIAVLVIVGIIVPIVKISQRPVFSLHELRDEKGAAKRRRCRMLVDNLKANCDLSTEEVAQLEGYLKQGDCDEELIAFFERRIVPGIDSETKATATTAFFVAAIAHSPLISTVTMLSLCFDLVRSIVEHCGFRPTNLGLAHLYTRVMLSALIIGGIEDADLSELFGQMLGGGAGARAGGLVLGSATDGLVSAFLVFRVGVITKRWLRSADGPANLRSLRRSTYKEALHMMRDSDFVSTVTAALKEMTGTVTRTVTDHVVDHVSEAGRKTTSRLRRFVFGE
jgi:putative membrane protein